MFGVEKYNPWYKKNQNLSYSDFSFKDFVSGIDQAIGGPGAPKTTTMTDAQATQIASKYDNQTAVISTQLAAAQASLDKINKSNNTKLIIAGVVVFILLAVIVYIKKKQ